MRMYKSMFLMYRGCGEKNFRSYLTPGFQVPWSSSRLQ